MHDGSPGYTMAELLTALGAAMMCSVLLALLSQWAAQMIVAQPFLIQDQMAVLQLRLYLAQCDHLQLEQGALQVEYGRETFTLQLHQHRLVKRPGYEIFLTDVEDANFFREGDAYYLEWQREETRWRAKVSE